MTAPPAPSRCRACSCLLRSGNRSGLCAPHLAAAEAESRAAQARSDREDAARHKARGNAARARRRSRRVTPRQPQPPCPAWQSAPLSVPWSALRPVDEALLRAVAAAPQGISYPDAREILRAHGLPTQNTGPLRRLIALGLVERTLQGGHSGRPSPYVLTAAGRDRAGAPATTAPPLDGCYPPCNGAPHAQTRAQA